MRLIRALLVLAFALGVIIIVMRFAFGLPERGDVPVSLHVPASEETALGRAILPRVADGGGDSGMVPLAAGTDAFAARVLLARAAEETLDVQYYIWEADTTGALLLEELRAAAERGVRVRLLLDDNGIAGLDPVLSALDALDTFEVRLFNPFPLRQPKLLSYAFDFPRLNRRMHNKSFTADGVATIVGGRNIGDIYFAYGPGTHYIDTDVMALGPAAADVSEMFDAYWNSASAYPAGRLLPVAPGGLDELAERVDVARADVDAAPYLQAILQSSLIGDLTNGAILSDLVPITLVADDPAKALGRPRTRDLLVHRLEELLSAQGLGVDARVDLVSAYFVPRERGSDILSRLARQGKTVRVLTNSHGATDVTVVHAAYAEDRPALVAAGVDLFELKPDPGAGPLPRDLLGLFGASASSLHSKVFAVDGRYAFIGSFNFDPRSVALNTEMGFLIESPQLAEAIHAAVDRVSAGGAYQVVLAGDGAVGWVDPATGTTLDLEPDTTGMDRFLMTVIAYLPVEWML